MEEATCVESSVHVRWVIFKLHARRQSLLRRSVRDTFEWPSQCMVATTRRVDRGEPAGGTEEAPYVLHIKFTSHDL